MNSPSEPLRLPAPSALRGALPATAEGGRRDDDGQIWRQLAYLDVYRLVLAVVCLVIVGFGSDLLEIAPGNVSLFAVTSLAYLFLGLATLPMVLWRIGQPERLAHLLILGDIVAITLLMHASGGVHSGFGMLLVVAVATGSLILAGETSRFLAAVAVLAVLAEQIVNGLAGGGEPASYTRAGLLGAGLFATAILAHTLARRLRETEALAARRGVDLANMAQLTEYIIQRMQTGIVVVDADGRLRLINESARQLLSMPPGALPDRLDELPEALSERLRRWLDGIDNEASSFRAGPAGTEVQPRFARLDQSSRSGALIFLEDLAAAAQQAQQIKLVSLGRLTASIAHEIRNPLAAICHAGQLLGEAPGLGEGERRLVEIILNHGQRVNTIVRNIMQLSRRERSQPSCLELGPWLDAFAMRFRADHGLADDRLVVDLDPEGVTVQFDPEQLQMIVDNLCQNALRHGDRRDPRLRLEARHGGDGRRPVLDVVDNGPGIDPDHRDHLFEPFFTTARDGTGLGLYIARELCESNQAQIALMPAEAGRSGCRFRITFADPRRRQIP